MNEAPFVSITGVCKTFKARAVASVEVLRDVDLSIAPGEFVSVIGPSGCGKSTLFGLITGLEAPNAGTVSVGGLPASKGKDQVAYMPQKDQLLPWRTVIQNVMLPLEIQGVKKSVARERAQELFDAFGLAGFENSYPFALSGGMRQRAAVLRTIVQERPLLLMDEPFGALDSLTRVDMQEFLLDIWERHRRTVMFVTHDIREALFLSDRVYVMSPRPARVQRVVEVPLPRPRTLDMLTSPEFVAMEEMLLHALRDEAVAH